MKLESSAVRSAAKDNLAQTFSEVPIGGTITHEDIAEILGDLTSPGALKSSAFLEAEKEYGAAFENVRGIGYRRMEAADISRVGTYTRHGIRRRARRGASKITAVMSMNQNSMTSADRIRAHAELGLLGIIQLAAGRGASNRAHAAAEAADKDKHRPPSTGEIGRAIMSAFGGAANAK